MSEYNTPLFKVVYFDNDLKQTVIKNKVFSFTVHRLVEELMKNKISQLTINRI